MKHFFKILLFFLSLSLYAQNPAPFAYGIKTNTIIPFSSTSKVDVNSGLSVNTTTAGFVPPRMTTTQKLAISSPVAGTLVYDSTIGGYQLFNGTSWVAVGGSSSDTFQDVTERDSITSHQIEVQGIKIRSDFNSATPTSVIIGGNAGSLDFSKPNQNAFGYNSGYNSTGNIQNAFGTGSGYGNTGDNQIAIGHTTGADNSGDNTIQIGSDAGGSNTGNNVVQIGNNSGYGNSYSNVIQIGAGVNTVAANQDNQFVIQTGSHYPIRLNTNTLGPITINPWQGDGTAARLEDIPVLDSDLTDIAALSPPNDNLLQRKAGVWTSRTPAQVKSDLAISIGDVSGAEPSVSTGTTSQYYRGDKTWQTLDATAVGAAPVSAGTFSGAFSLDKPGGNLFNDLAQSGSLTLSVGGSAIVGGCDCVKITANGSAITVPGAWINIGNDSVSTTNGNINRICVMKTASEIWYSVKVN